MSSSRAKLYTLSAVVLMLAASSVTFVVLTQPPAATEPTTTGPTTTQPTTTEPFVRLVPLYGTPEDMSVDELMSMDAVIRTGSFQDSYGSIKGQGQYCGPKISDLIELVGGMDEDHVIIVNASDGYSQIFTYSNAYPNQFQYAIQGDMILAIEFEGTMIPDYADGPRLMFLPEDGCYSNADTNLTIDPQFFPGSAGAAVVSNVVQIVIAEKPVEEPNILFINQSQTTVGHDRTETTAVPSIAVSQRSHPMRSALASSEVWRRPSTVCS